MTFTFEQARAAVKAQNGPAWEDQDMKGTYMVAEYGKEDDELFLVIDGAKEAMVGNDPAYIVMDQPAMFVHKETGVVMEAVFLEVADRIQAMTEVGDWPEEPEDYTY
jgi:hypothetical protein